MDDIGDKAGSDAGRAGAIEEWLMRSLAQGLQSHTPLLAQQGMSGLEGPLQGFDRGDLRSAQTVPDDGGERLSTAPAATDLNGQAQLAWGAQAGEWLHAAEQRQWRSALAQQLTVQQDQMPQLLHAADPLTPPTAAPTADLSAPLAAPMTAGDVRDMQSGATLDWDRFRNNWLQMHLRNIR